MKNQITLTSAQKEALIKFSFNKPKSSVDVNISRITIISLESRGFLKIVTKDENPKLTTYIKTERVYNTNCPQCKMKDEILTEVVKVNIPIQNPKNNEPRHTKPIEVEKVKIIEPVISKYTKIEVEPEPELKRSNLFYFTTVEC
jgi:hypothetical protein